MRLTVVIALTTGPVVEFSGPGLAKVGGVAGVPLPVHGAGVGLGVGRGAGLLPLNQDRITGHGDHLVLDVHIEQGVGRQLRQEDAVVLLNDNVNDVHRTDIIYLDEPGPVLATQDTGDSGTVDGGHVVQVGVHPVARPVIQHPPVTKMCHGVVRKAADLPGAGATVTSGWV